MKTIFIALSLFTHDLDNGSAERVVMIRKADISAVYNSRCLTYKNGTGFFHDTVFSEAPCTKVLLNNQKEFEVQGDAIPIMIEVKDQ